MKSLVASALLGAAGLIVLALTAHAAGSTTVTDTPAYKSTTTTNYMQIARDENPGGAGYQKKGKKKKAKG